MWIIFCYNRVRIRNKGVKMVLPEDSNNAIVDALNRIQESLEDNNEVLKRIASHYDSIVPTMRKNQEALLDNNKSPLDKVYEAMSFKV